MEQDTIPTNPTKTTGSSRSTYVTGHKGFPRWRSIKSFTSWLPQRNNSKTIERKSKQSLFCHCHLYRNNVNKNVVTIIGDQILSGIDQHGLSNEFFQVRV